jgi:DNA invertase Pin-like site-specific DNA recombinase
MMRDARRGRFEVVLVWASDRIARSVKHFLDVLDELNRLNIEFVSFREQIDTGAEFRSRSAHQSANTNPVESNMRRNDNSKNKNPD